MPLERRAKAPLSRRLSDGSVYLSSSSTNTDARFADAARVTPLQHKSTVEHWRVMLAEFVHLLGLLLIHSRHAQSVRATSVLFDQMLSHLAVLEKMPGHEGTMILNCSRPKQSHQVGAIHYRVLFGNLILLRDSQQADVTPIAGKHAGYLNNALDQTFDYLLNYGIQSLYLQLPGESIAKTHQLSLALNIISRFQDAVQGHGSVTFHYGGRVRAIPVIRDSHNQPDYNLTLLAGINGLSAANAMELIKQAKAYYDMALSDHREGPPRRKMVTDSYTQIFKVRSLRSQIIQPPVEVNNIPWVVAFRHRMDADNTSKALTDNEMDGDKLQEKPPLEPVYLQRTHNDGSPAQNTRKFLGAYLDNTDSEIGAALDLVLVDDYASLDTQGIAERLTSTSRLLYAIEKKSQDPAVVDHLLHFLQGGLLQVSDAVLANIEVLRQGLRFINKGRAMMVGLVHPRLVDLITLVKDQVVTRYKTAIVRKIAFEFAHQYAGLVVEAFDISSEHAYHLLDFLHHCFDSDGSFYREAFENRLDAMAQQADAFFEINWCFLRETPRRDDRLAFLNAIQLLLVRLQDPKRAVRFLLDDLCQYPGRVDYTDRNAFVLANILLQNENKTLHVDLDRTPENLLLGATNIHGDVQRYTLWRINTDQVRVVAKIKSIHQAIEKMLGDSSQENQRTVDFLLALEREALIFLALVNGPTARKIMRGLLKLYGRHNASIYKLAKKTGQISSIIAQLQIVVRCMGCVGYLEDYAILEKVTQHADNLRALDDHPAHALQIKQTLKWVTEAVRMIHSQNG